MVLTDRTIRAEIEAGRIVFDPFDPALIQPSSVDVRVDRRFRVFHNARRPYIDVRQPMDDLTELVTVEDDEPFILHPGEFVLGQTLERVTLPDDLVARLEGKSFGRLGLLIHSTAGFVDPAFEGNLTLELSNVANLPITIYYAMPIGQISFMRMDGPVEHPYGSDETGSKYQGQAEPTPEPLLPELRALSSRARNPRRTAPVVASYHCPDAKRRTIGVGDRPDHRPGHLRAEEASGAGKVDGQGAARIQELRHGE